jgi:hypothetical protein
MQAPLAEHINMVGKQSFLTEGAVFPTTIINYPLSIINYYQLIKIVL